MIDIPVTVKVTNTGSMDGEEVVQLYVKGKNNKMPVPIKALKGFQRIFLKAGETKLVVFHLLADDVSLFDDNGNPVQFTGNFEISVGGGQPGTKRKTTSNVLTRTLNIVPAN